MPGKVNPVLAEMLDMAMFHVVGCDTTVAMAAQAGQLELNVMMPIIAHNLFEMMQVMIGAVNAFTERAVKGVTANREKAEGWLSKNAIIVTALKSRDRICTRLRTGKGSIGIQRFDQRIGNGEGKDWRIEAPR